jgi:uncharacterized protein YjiS (DUF1127 family)
MTQFVLTASNWLNISGLFEVFNDIYRNLKLRARKRAVRKQTLRELYRLSDHELHDIGNSRSDIMSLANGTLQDKDVPETKNTNDNLKGWV